jgi:hypothetical protein
VGALAHYIEEEGIATTQISLIREHTEIIKPPRALWVSFELGRPLGIPNDENFQLKVLRQALHLFAAETGPILEDFPEDAPDEGTEQTQIACPVSFGNRDEDNGTEPSLSSRFSREIEELSPWYSLSHSKKNRTTIGISGLSINEAANLLSLFTDNTRRPELLQDPALADQLRLACEDIKAYYFEAISSQPGQPTDGKSLAAWFWRDTAAALMINRAREICLAESSGKMRLLGKLLLIPRNQLHNFTRVE